MPCYDPPYDLPQMQASVVGPYVETLREIDKYCDAELAALEQARISNPELKRFTLAIQDMVHSRFREQNG
jgi:hypothetical protein